MKMGVTTFTVDAPVVTLKSVGRGLKRKTLARKAVNTAMIMKTIRSTRRLMESSALGGRASILMLASISQHQAIVMMMILA
jgi:hypothetical protein